LPGIVRGREGNTLTRILTPPQPPEHSLIEGLANKAKSVLYRGLRLPRLPHITFETLQVKGCNFLERLVGQVGLEPVAIHGMVVPGTPLVLSRPRQIMLFQQFPKSKAVGLALLLGLIGPGAVLLQEFIAPPLGRFRGPALRGPPTALPAELAGFGILEGNPVTPVGPLSPLLYGGFGEIDPSEFF
jgi:hypothetical protein